MGSINKLGLMSALLSLGLHETFKGSGMHREMFKYSGAVKIISTNKFADKQLTNSQANARRRRQIACGALKVSQVSQVS